MIIVVTGTPGTGKSTLSKKLAKSYNHKYVDVRTLLHKSDICEAYDTDDECMIVDPKKLSKMLVDMIKKNDRLVIDSHLAHCLPKKYVDLCVVCKCELPELKRRLKERGYNTKKVRDNLDSEIFDIILTEAQEENKHNVIVVETSSGYNLKDIVDKINGKTKSSSA